MMTSKLRQRIVELLRDCPFGHHNGRVLTSRQTTEADLVAWIDRLYEIKETLTRDKKEVR
jgi:hypothetical protein